MTEKGVVLREENFYDMLSYLVSSAYLMSQGEEFEEFYPSLRLVDSANRLIKFALESGGLDNENWPRSFQNKIEEGIVLMGKDNEAFTKFLLNSTLMLTKEMRRREEE